MQFMQNEMGKKKQIKFKIQKMIIVIERTHPQCTDPFT